MNGKKNSKYISKSTVEIIGLPKPPPPTADIFEYTIRSSSTGEVQHFKKDGSVERSSSQGSKFVYTIKDVGEEDEIIYQNEKGKSITYEVETETKLITIEFPNQNFERVIQIYPKETPSPYSKKIIYIAMAATVFIILFLIVFFTTRKNKNTKIEKVTEPIRIQEKPNQAEKQKSDEEILFNKHLYELKSILGVLINTNQSAKDKFLQANAEYQKASPQIQQHKDIKALMAKIESNKEVEEKQEIKDKSEYDKRFTVISEATREAEQKIKKEQEEEIIFNRDLEKLKTTLEIVISSKQSAQDKFAQANEYYKQNNGKIQQHEQIQDLMFKIRKSKEVEEQQKSKIEETQEEVKETADEAVITSDFEKKIFYLSSNDSLEKVKELKTGRNKSVSSTIFIIEQISENEATLETYPNMQSNFFTSFYHALYNFEFAFDVMKRPSTAPTLVKTIQKGKLIKERNVWKVVEKAKIEFH